MSVLLLAAATLVIPGPNRVRARLAQLTAPLLEASGPATPGRAGRATRPTWLLPAVAAVAVGALPVLLVRGSAGVLAGVGLVLGVFLTGRRALGGRRTVVPRRSPPDPLRLAASWDLLAACLRAGLPVPLAVRAVAGELPTAAAAALRRSGELMALGADPVACWAPALADPDLAPLARAARRTARSGTALAGAATELAEEVRSRARDHEEERAQRAAVLITGPLGLCFLPAFLCLGVLPVVMALASRLAPAW